MNKISNIFDPIQEELDQSIFNGITPRKRVVDFIYKNIKRVFEKELELDDFDHYFDLYLTGSLTTYQYSETSDCDISVFPIYELLDKDPNSLRKELIAIVIDKLDGTFVPGTQHPLQHFIVPPAIEPSDLYKPGLRSAWSFQDKTWIVPPEKERVKDIATELPTLYLRAQLMAEKMERLIDYDPIYAKEFWKQVHRKRQLDERSGLGDFSEGNIVYKYMLHIGLFDRLRNELGIKIAQKTTTTVNTYHPSMKDESNDVLKVIYDFENDRILLGTTSEEISSKIMGEYDNGDVIFYRIDIPFNVGYFRKLWFHSFPERPLNSIYIDNGR